MLHFARWKLVAIALTCLFGLTFTAPNFFSRDQVITWPNFVPKGQLQYGLDLQGGSHLLIELEKKDLLVPWMKSLAGEARRNLLKAKIKYQGRSGVKVVDNNRVEITLREPEKSDDALKALRPMIQQLQGNVFTGPGGPNLSITQNGGGKFTITPTQAAIAERVTNAVSAAIEVFRRRVDQLGTTEPNITRQGENRVIVQVPGFDDPERLKELLEKVGSLQFKDVHPTLTAATLTGNRAPVGYEIVEATQEEGGFRYILLENPIVTGADLVDAQPSFDGRTNEPVVAFRFNASGARKFGNHTQANVQRPFAIVLDGKVISAPVIQSPILGGSGQISGNPFTVKEADDLAILLRSGSLQVKPTIIEERTVGAGLGADSVDASKIASVIGLAGVLIFMLVAYGRFGFFANIALLMNIVILVGALSMLQATLTLPGIAGIVLTIGMAVDANVLIFERIREELRAGKPTISAIDAGYSRALGTILDANITTFIAAFILFFLGSGPIRGFAVTLSIGILTSVFTAFTLTRLFVSWWVNRQQSRKIEAPI